VVHVNECYLYLCALDGALCFNSVKAFVSSWYQNCRAAASVPLTARHRSSNRQLPQAASVLCACVPAFALSLAASGAACDIFSATTLAAWCFEQNPDAQWAAQVQITRRRAACIAQHTLPSLAHLLICNQVGSQSAAAAAVTARRRRRCRPATAAAQRRRPRARLRGNTLRRGAASIAAAGGAAPLQQFTWRVGVTGAAPSARR
jgi:hypothetical protein